MDAVDLAPLVFWGGCSVTAHHPIENKLTEDLTLNRTYFYRLEHMLKLKIQPLVGKKTMGSGFNVETLKETSLVVVKHRSRLT